MTKHIGAPPPHFVLYRLEVVLLGTTGILCIGHWRNQPVQHVAMRVLGIGGDDGGRRKVDFLEPEGGAGSVEAEAKVAPDTSDSGHSKRTDRPSRVFGIWCLGKVVRGDNSFVQVSE